MINVNFAGITKEYGCCVYTSVKMPEEYTMNQLVEAIKFLGYSMFKTETMKVFVKID